MSAPVLSPKYLAIEPDGATRSVEPTYAGIKDGLHDAGFDCVRLPDGYHELYVDDEGMLTGGRLNVIASLISGVALYGPVVMTGGVGDEGETLRPHLEMVRGVSGLCAMWAMVESDAARKGQDIGVRADPNFLPSPSVVMLTEEETEGIYSDDPEVRERTRRDIDDRVTRQQFGLEDEPGGQP